MQRKTLVKTVLCLNNVIVVTFALGLGALGAWGVWQWLVFEPKSTGVTQSIDESSETNKSMFEAPTNVTEQSFNCGNAQTYVEKTICYTTNLTALDAEMFAL